VATTYIRKSIWGLETPGMWDPYTTAYAKAVAEMNTRSEDDPTSWAYQAAMHDSYTDPPPNAVWNQCQHGSWFFLPWHRMYLYWFERIVRAIVVQQGGPSDWALPFWNYSLGPPGDALPPAFRQPAWDPGTGSGPNPLYTAQRRRVADPNDPAQHVYLNVEGLKADHTPGVSWEVHLNLPPDAGPEAGSRNWDGDPYGRPVARALFDSSPTPVRLAGTSQ
jgi:hypothetical protein